MKEQYVSVPTYGAHAYKIEGEVDHTQSFPPAGAKFIAVLAGRYTPETPPPDAWIEQVKEMGATHLALGQGENFAVRGL